MDIKICKTCVVEKGLSFFPKSRRKKDGSIYFYPNCKTCSKSVRSAVCKKYYQNNKEEILFDSRTRYHNNLEVEHQRGLIYRENNKELIKKNRNQRAQKARIENPSFRLKSNVSRRIRHILKKNNSSKGGKTILNYLKYSIEELKKHLEKQFELWMSWDNYGQYKKSEWNDTDINTWFWNIDHIIPQSLLQYSSMEDENFQKCWALSNLRPLSAKENFYRGIDLLRINKL